MNIIAISGRAGSGKSLVSACLKELLSNENNNWETKSFSSVLKIISSFITKENYHVFCKNKEKTLPFPWENFTARKFLQEVGTKLREVDPEFWIKALTVEENIIIDDLRFKNEFEWVKSQGGITIRVERFTKGYYYTYGLEVKNNAHVSETELDSEEFDFTIINNGTIIELYEKIKNLMESDEFKNRVFSNN